MRNRSSLALVATPALAALTLLTACGVTPPELTVTDAYVAERSDAGTVIHVVVKAENHTTDPLPMWAIAYSPGGEGVSAGSISRWTQATAPPGGTVSFELPLVVTTPAASPSTVTVAGKIAYVPGSKLRELLSEIDFPLPTTSFSGTLPIDWNAAPRETAQLRPGAFRTANIIDRGPAKAFDTLPPLKEVVK